VIVPGVRVVALNTQWGDGFNAYLLLEEDQKQVQWKWLIQTLSTSETNGEKVILMYVFNVLIFRFFY